MGLSSQGYNGHIFWDSELWMYPSLLALQPAMAKSCLDYRSDRLRKQNKKQLYMAIKDNVSMGVR
jgi:trehalose/maltose hydrolase-like predicted phosphorylase